ncbi:MAG: branched-chain amino acid ABC transporter permease [Acidobacteriia bacterium]|nr:branched-chain amino acid ABC transporter permease [Methyloceanibacter sp.]MCL6490626.1 branched-chain amino acid ABC transporter permease [Terriglobia bacterium]
MAPTRLSRTEFAIWVAAAVAVVGLPLLLPIFSIVQLTVFLIFCLLAVSLDLAWGLAGLLSFGHAAFFGVGGYAYGILAVNGLATPAALLAGGISGALLAGILGYVAFYGRVSTIFLAVMTLTVTLILLQVMGSTADPSYRIGSAVLGGYNGITNIPSLALGLPLLPSIELGPAGFFRFVGGFLIVVLALGRLMTFAPFGRILATIRENEQRTELSGYDVRWRKLAVFAASGGIAGVAGGLFASWGNFINPEVFSLSQSAQVVIWVLVGGRGLLYGAVIGALVVQALTQYLGAIGTAYTALVLGLLMVAFVLLLREGLVPTFLRLSLILPRHKTPA